MTQPYGSAVPSLPASDAREVGPRMPWQLAAAIALLFVAGARTFVGIVLSVASYVRADISGSIFDYLRPLFLAQAVLALAMIAFAVAGLLVRNIAVWVGLLVAAAGGAAASIWQVGTVVLSPRMWESSFIVRILVGALIGLAPLVVAAVLLLMPEPRRYLAAPTLAEGVRHVETKPGVVLAAQIIAGIVAALSTLLAVVAIAAQVMPDGRIPFAGLSGTIWGGMLPGALAGAIAYAVAVFALGARRDWARVGLITIVVHAVVGQLASVVWSLDLAGVLPMLIAGVIGGVIVALLAHPATRAWCDH